MGSKQRRQKRGLRKLFQHRGYNITKSGKRRMAAILALVGSSAKPVDNEASKAAQKQKTDSSGSGDTKEQEVSEEARGQELCEKIKNSLKQLRRLSTGEESSEYKENPTLNLEVFPEEAKNPGDTGKTQDDDQDTGEPSSEFHDESETPELLAPKKTKAYKLPAKPIKINPRRQAVIRQEIQKSILAAQKSPALEKVFVNSIEKRKKTNPDTYESAKSTHSDSSEVPSLNRTEQLYEFGKYVAEQMMCFDEKEVGLAQQEIKEVLSKFRLKYKIMKCLSKPKNDQPESNKDSQVVTQPAKKTRKKNNTTKLQTKPTTKKTSKQSVTKYTPLEYIKIPKKSVSLTDSAGSSATPFRQRFSTVLLSEPLQMISSGSFTTPSLQMNTPQPSEIQNGSQMISAGSFVTTSLQMNTAGPSVIQNGSQMIRASSLMTPSLEINTAGSSGLQNGPHITISGLPVLPQMVSVGTTDTICGNTIALKALEGFNKNSSLSTPIGFVVVPSSSEYQVPTQLVDSVRTMVQPATLQVNPNQTVTQPEEVNSESLGHYKMPPTHFVDVPVNEPESLIIKYEAPSDEET